MSKIKTASWPDEVRLEMVEKSEFYSEPTIYQYGYYDGYQKAYYAAQSLPVTGEDRERIICAANYYQDGLIHQHQPKNISNGFVTCGRRHHNCIGTFALIVGFPYTEEGGKIQNTEVQGFLTNKNLFVDRKEAYKIAFKANQIIGPNKGHEENEIGLTSEDLY
jgi:hypothetical protein